MRCGRLAAILGGLTLLGAGCGSGAASAPGAPVLRVVTAAFPFAQAAAQIGGDKVQVSDVVPTGLDPRTYQPTAAQAAQIRSAGLVIEVGGGFQPGFEADALGASHVIETSRTVGGSNPFVWLDPNTMQSAIGAIANAMAQANPPAAAIYKQDASAYDQQIGSAGFDYQSTLDTCPHTTILSPDRAFSSVSHDYGLHQLVAGSQSVRSLVAQATAAGVSTVVAETWTDNTVVQEVAAAAHIKLVTLDTLTGPPVGGWPKSDYSALLEANLGTLSDALGCNALGPN